LNALKLHLKLSLQKKTDLTRFFIIKPRHAGRLKKSVLGEKKRKGSLGHTRKNADYLT